MRSKSQILSKLRADGHITDEEYKALEQEPCEDANANQHNSNALNDVGQHTNALEGDVISRHAVLDAIDVKAWEFCDYLISKNRNDEQKPVSHFADNLRECVREELPSVNPQPKTGHWIPVSERLPDEKDYCLCCDKDGYMTIGFISQWSKEWCFDDPEIDIDVVAWMPLPPCYKSQESEG